MYLGVRINLYNLCLNNRSSVLAYNIYDEEKSKFFLSNFHYDVAQEAQRNVSIMHTPGTESLCLSPL